MSKKPKPTGLPFEPELGPSLGSGQDNMVFRLVGHAEKPHLRPPIGQVVKINHATVGEHRVRAFDDREAAWRGVLYKKNKYELLKLFLGDFVPQSSFVLGEVTEKGKKRYAEYTIQEEVPRVSISGLTEQQKQDPRLTAQVTDLMERLQYMYKVMGDVNARTAEGVSIDGKLDLGGISDYVRGEDLDHRFNETDAKTIIEENNSPNLLVNPNTLQLYCVDFDQGQWRPGNDEAKALAERIVERDGAIAALSGFAITGTHQGQLF